MYIKIIYAVLELFGIFAVGAVARHLEYIKEQDLNHWSRLIIDFLFPLLVFYSIVENLDTDRISDLIALPLLGIGLMILGMIIGFLMSWGLRNKSDGRDKTFLHFCTINNYGFLPIIIISNLWGQSALPLLFILNIGSSIGFWTIGVMVLGESNWRKTLKNMFSPNLVAIILALFLALSGTREYVPDMLLKICHTLGANAVPFMLLIIGATIYNSPHLTRNIGDIVYVTILRLILIPILSILILKSLPLPDNIYQIAYIVAIMPTSVSSTIITRCYGGSPDFAAQAALVTTTVSLVTLPIFLCFI